MSRRIGWTLHVRPDGMPLPSRAMRQGLDELIERLLPLAAELVAVEATGGFETVVAAALAGAGLPVVVVNPAQVRAFAQALGKRAKTDPIDAAVIARFAAADQPEVRPLPDEATRLLADLVARRRQIIEMIVAERQREQPRHRRRLKRASPASLTALQKELAEPRCRHRRRRARLAGLARRRRTCSPPCPASGRSSPAP